MQLELKNLIPEPLKDRSFADSDIWDKSCSVSPGERIFLRAPSGKGKSTFIHILYGLRNDFSGTAYWGNKAIKQQHPDTWSAWRRTKLSIVFQDLRLFPELSLAENLFLKQSLAEYTSMEEVREWVSMLGLNEKWEQKCATLSYGEKQRVAIIRALLQPFQWLLLDEPFSHLDKDNIEKAVSLIEMQLHKRNAGMIMVDLEDEERLAFNKKWLL